jgi:SAM-dependent methyltransferase
VVAEVDQYFLGYRQAEQERLQRQALELAPEAEWLFDQIGVQAGARVVEIGCGPQGCLELLSQRVGPTGSVVGVERSEDAVELARKFATERGLKNVEVLNCDARRTGLPRDRFDLATARLVLVNIPKPEDVVSEMAALVRPGGTVALHEASWATLACDPPLPAWDRLLKALSAYAALNGIDLSVATRVPRMLREAGLVEIRLRPLIHAHPPGHPRRAVYPQFVENLRDRLIEQRVIEERDLDQDLQELRCHIDNPTTLIVSHLAMQVWGRRPEQ